MKNNHLLFKKVLWKCLMSLQIISNVTLTWSGPFTILKIDGQMMKSSMHALICFNKIWKINITTKCIVYKTFFQQYLQVNHLQKA